MSNGDELNTSFVASLMNMGGSNFGTSLVQLISS